MHLTLLKSLKSSFVFIGFLFFSCNSDEKRIEIDESYKKAHADFQARLANGRKNYLKLNGLFLLGSGTNTFGAGADRDCAIEIAGLPLQVGTISIAQDSVTFAAADDVEITNEENAIISDGPLTLDQHGSSSRFSFGRLEWRVITRSGQYYLRTSDNENPSVDAFKGFAQFELNPAFVFEGKFTYYQEPKADSVHSYLGVDEQTEFIGKVSFSHQDQSYQLDVGSNGFTMVGDQTTGNETYGGGRYLYLDLPDTDSLVVLDFNYLYNPPCAFSKFTTCLYPPKQNQLAFKILAGEKILTK